MSDHPTPPTTAQRHLRLATTTPSAPDVPEVPKGYALTQDLSAPALRLLLRQHLAWLFGAGGGAIVAMILPSQPWYWGLLQAVLMLASFIVGGTRLMQLNGILAELRKRDHATEP